MSCFVKTNVKRFRQIKQRESLSSLLTIIFELLDILFFLFCFFGLEILHAVFSHCTVNVKTHVMRELRFKLLPSLRI